MSTEVCPIRVAGTYCGEPATHRVQAMCVHEHQLGGPCCETCVHHARRLFLTAINGTGARFGDYATITAGQGVSLPQNVEVTISASDADPVDLLDLYASGVYVPSGVTVTVAYAV